MKYGFSLDSAIKKDDVFDIYYKIGLTNSQNIKNICVRGSRFRRIRTDDCGYGL